MATALSRLRPRRGQLLFLLLSVATLYIVLPRIDFFNHSLGYLHGANWAFIGLALLATALTNVLAALTYNILAKHHLSYRRTLLVQLAGNFVNRILPAGIGGIGINYVYLRRHNHSQSQAASVVAANNLVGLSGHLLLIFVILLTMSGRLDGLNIAEFRHSIDNQYLWSVPIVMIIIFLIIYFWQRLAERFMAIIKQLLAYRRHPLMLLAALLSSISLTLANVLSLYYSSLGLRLHLSMASLLVVFTFGILLGSVTPTPGGFGGIEAGLVVGLMAFHVTAAEALALTLVYRLISCWLPVIVGVVAYYFADHLGYLRLKDQSSLT